MNNRTLFKVVGFGRGPKVKVELLSSSLPREIRPRAKSGTPAQVAAYLARTINEIVARVPPKFTHTERDAQRARTRRRPLRRRR